MVFDPSDPVRVPEVPVGDCPLYVGFEDGEDDHVTLKLLSYGGIVKLVDWGSKCQPVTNPIGA